MLNKGDEVMKKNYCSKLIAFILFLSMCVPLPQLSAYLNLYAYGAEETIDGHTYTYTIENDEVTITDFTRGASTSVTIPSMISGCPVTVIGEDAFWDKGITSIVIPDSVTTIEDGAFSYNPDLVQVIIENEDTVIGGAAFDAFDPGIEPSDLTIRGYAGSTAETYAMENGHTFSPLLVSLEPGTFIDGDGDIGINKDPLMIGDDPVIAEFNDVLYAAWEEDQQLRVAVFNGSEWTFIDGNGENGINYNAEAQARDPDIAIYDNEIYVIWNETAPSEYNQIKIKKYNGDEWIEIGDSENNYSFNYDTGKSASSAKLIVYDGKLYAVWREYNSNYVSQLRLMEYDGTDWIPIDGGGDNGLNFNSQCDADDPVIASDDSYLYLMWKEKDSDYKTHLRVKRFDGSDWEYIDGGQSIADVPLSNVFSISMIIAGSEIYASWVVPDENFIYQIRVKKYDGTSWTFIDGDEQILNYSASSIHADGIKLLNSNGSIYAFWYETISIDFLKSQIRAKKYDGTSWVSVDGAGAAGLNKNTGQSAIKPYPIAVDDDIYIIWQEENDDNNTFQIRVRKHSDDPGIEENENPGRSTRKPSNKVSVTVGDKTEQAATVDKQNQGGRTVTTVTLNTQIMTELVNSGQPGATVTIPVNSSNSEVSVGRLNGELVKTMGEKQNILEIQTDSAAYIIPTEEIDIEAISGAFGDDVALSDIEVHITIGEPSDEMIEVVEDTADEGGFMLVVPPVEFNITCTYGNETVAVSRFDNYVERRIAIPDGIDPGKITTAVVVEEDGTLRHVPTMIKVIDGKYYAVINSLTNSIYSVIYNPVEFDDVFGHWAKDVINDMASRMVISGDGNGNYDPDRDITRAEFATIVIRALGLKAAEEVKAFGDVRPEDWFGVYVQIAYENGIVSGTGNGNFKPNDKITREQAMLMISKAMDITGLKVQFAEGETQSLLRGFKDSSLASDWAVSGISSCLKAGLVSGKGGSILAPSDNITRAEVAVIVSNLLQKSSLI